MKPSTVASKTMAIKARVYNQIRKDLFKKKEKLTFLEGSKEGKFIPDISIKEMSELFTKWFLLNKDAHHELNAYKRKRKEAKAIHEQRLKSGYYAKKKEKYLWHSKKMIEQGNPRDKAKKVS